jgi:hypothetical protein
MLALPEIKEDKGEYDDKKNRGSDYNSFHRNFSTKIVSLGNYMEY